MEDNHSILYNYYSKYNAGNPAIRRIASSAPSIFKSVMHDFVPKSKSFSNKVFKGVLNTVGENTLTEVLKGNNPFDTFKKNIESRIKNSDEYLYQKYLEKDKQERAQEAITRIRDAAIKNRNLGLPFDKSLFTYDPDKYNSDKYNFEYKYELDPESNDELKNDDYNMYGGKLLEQLRIDIGRTNFDFELNKLKKEILEIRYS